MSSATFFSFPSCCTSIYQPAENGRLKPIDKQESSPAWRPLVVRFSATSAGLIHDFWRLSSATWGMPHILQILQACKNLPLDEKYEQRKERGRGTESLIMEWREEVGKRRVHGTSLLLCKVDIGTYDGK